MQKMTTAEAQKQLINIVKSVTQENESYQINDERGSAILISQNTALVITVRDSRILSLPYLPFRFCPRWISKTLYLPPLTLNY